MNKKSWNALTIKYKRSFKLEKAVGNRIIFSLHATTFLFLFSIALYISGATLNQIVMNANGDKMPVYSTELNLSFVLDERHKIINSLEEAKMPLFIDRHIFYGSDLKQLPDFIKNMISYSIFYDPISEDYIYNQSVGDIMIIVAVLLYMLSALFIFVLLPYVLLKSRNL